MLPVLLLATIPAQAAPLLASPQPSPRAADTTDPGEFQRVHLAGAVALDLFSQEAHRSAKIDCPTSQGAGLQLQVSGDTLHVTPQHESQRSSDTCKLTLRVPSLHAIAVSGAATVRGGALTGLTEVTVAGTAALDLRGIQSESFALQVSGDGRARLSGKVDQLSIQSSGSVTIDAKALAARTGEFSSQGAGDITATVHTTARVRTAGAGNVVLYGQPELVESSASGSGTIERR